MRREIPVVIKKDGGMFIPKFPVTLEEEDKLIMTREMAGSQVPKGQRWVVSGCTMSGPRVERTVV